MENIIYASCICFVIGLGFGGWIKANQWAANAVVPYRISWRGKLYKVYIDEEFSEDNTTKAVVENWTDSEG